MLAMDAERAQAQDNLSQESAALAEHLRRSTVVVRGRGPGGGSGVIWRSNGLVVTNAHVARSPRLVVELNDGHVCDAVVEARDPERDLAAIIIEADGLTAARIGDSDALRVGELVLAVGNPLGLVGAVTTGIIHAVPPRDVLVRGAWLQADIRLAPGSSGGPLADARGRVIGINSMVAGGLALAVPSNAVWDFLSATRERPHLGVTLRPVFFPLRGKGHRGLLVLEVEAGSPAEKAGLSVGDVLIGVGGQLIDGPYDVARMLRHSARAGASTGLSLDFLRGGRLETREVFLSSKARVA